MIGKTVGLIRIVRLQDTKFFNLDNNNYSANFDTYKLYILGIMIYSKVINYKATLDNNTKSVGFKK